MGAAGSTSQSTEDVLLEQKALLQFQHGTCGDFTASFEKIDTDGNGELDRDEFAVAANAIGMSINDEDTGLPGTYAGFANTSPELRRGILGCGAIDGRKAVPPKNVDAMRKGHTVAP